MRPASSPAPISSSTAASPPVRRSERNHNERSCPDVLAGRVVAVTGAARGIGAGIVEAVLEAGGSAALIDLALPGRRRPNAGQLDLQGQRTLPLCGRVTDPASCLRRRVPPSPASARSTAASTMPETAAGGGDDHPPERAGAANSRSTPRRPSPAPRRPRAFAGRGGAIVKSPRTPERSASPTWPPTTRPRPR